MAALRGRPFCFHSLLAVCLESDIIDIYLWRMAAGEDMCFFARERVAHGPEKQIREILDAQVLSLGFYFSIVSK